jgi:hypothetical protein
MLPPWNGPSFVMKISLCAQGRLARTSFEPPFSLFRYCLSLFGVLHCYTLVCPGGILEVHEGG